MLAQGPCAARPSRLYVHVVTGPSTTTDLVNFWARFDPSPPSVWTSKKNQASVILDLDLEYVCGGPCCACAGAIRGKGNLFLFLDFKCYVQITLKMTKLQQSKYWM